MIQDKTDSIYYIYYYLREHNSCVANAGTPYYVGIGKGNRINRKGPGEIPMPPNPKFRIKIMENIPASVAIMLEKLHIRLWGRVDNASGILRNKTDGGDGTMGRIMPDSERQQRSKIQKEVQNRPDVKLKRNEGMRIANAALSTKAKRSASASKFMSDPFVREKHSASMLQWWNDNPEAKIAASNRGKEYWSDPNKVESKRQEAKRRWTDESYRLKRSESFQKTAATEQFKKNKREAQLGLKFWNNGIHNIRAKECPNGYVPGRIKPITNQNRLK